MSAPLVSAYPARRLLRWPRTNRTLHAAVGIGIGIQILTLAVPGLRDALGLSLLDLRAAGIVAAVVVATWLVAELVNLGLARWARGQGDAPPAPRSLGRARPAHAQREAKAWHRG